jgi:hypothetical protein
MKSKALLKDYFKAITDVASQGDAREESFYSCLETLRQQFAASTDRSEVHVTTLPKKTEAGNPDFRVWNDQDRIIGYIEAKKPTEENLDYEEIKTYCRVVTVIQRTIALQEEIDALYPEAESQIVEIVGDK